VGNLRDIGIVYLVGAGPGDSGLITVRGIERLQVADVVVYDRLINCELLEHAPEHADLIDVGKVPGSNKNSQEKINDLIVQKASEGSTVVRLKGGDPFVFGRGAEEVQSLAKAGIPFEIVPGITSALAVPAYAGIPMTRRGVSSSITITTGTEGLEKSSREVPWEILAKTQGTLSILMGWEHLSSISAALQKGGRPADTPVAVIQWGTFDQQRTVIGTLSNIAVRAEQQGFSSPVVIVIGEVVNHREESQWFDNRPLFGKRILVTRSRTQASSLSKLLRSKGAHPLEMPTIEIQPLTSYTAVDEALRHIADYHWVVFTSTNAVDAVWGRIQAMDNDARAFHGNKIAAVGSATGEHLNKHGLVPDLVASESISESLLASFEKQGVTGQRVLLPGAENRRRRLPCGLKEMGAEVQELTLYRTVLPASAKQRLGRILDQGVDVITFTSSSTVQNLVALLDGGPEQLANIPLACIGPVTKEAAENLGLNVDILAGKANIDGLVDAITTRFAQESTP